MASLKLPLLLSALTLSSLLGCGEQNSKVVLNDTHESLAHNSQAKNLAEWESSDFTPEKIFTKWQETQISPSDVCEILQSKSGQDLSLFEEEIKSEKNQSLTAPCKDSLLKKIDQFYEAEKKKMFPETSGDLQGLTNTALNSFRFPDRVDFRDVSKGYMAVRGDVAPKEVVLTFDDGPHPQYTESILADLERVNAKAIFFALGRSVKAYPAILQKQAYYGHMIGSHSYTHPCLGQNKRCDEHNRKNSGRTLSYSDSVNEIVKGHRAVYEALGWVAPFFRFPYGESAGMKDYLKSNGIGEFFWNIDSNDWRNQSPKQLADQTIMQIEKEGRGIVLFHDVQRRTAEMMPYFLSQLYHKGFSVVLLKPSDEQALVNSALTN